MLGAFINLTGPLLITALLLLKRQPSISNYIILLLLPREHFEGDQALIKAKFTSLELTNSDTFLG